MTYLETFGATLASLIQAHPYHALAAFCLWLASMLLTSLVRMVRSL